MIQSISTGQPLVLHGSSRYADQLKELARDIVSGPREAARSEEVARRPAAVPVPVVVPADVAVPELEPGGGLHPWLSGRSPTASTARDPGFRETPGWGIGSSARDDGAAPGPGPARGETGQSDMLAVKSHIHRKLLERLNLSNLDRLDRDEVMETIRSLVRELLAAEAIPLNLEERDELIRQVLDEIFGLGPLQPLVDDPTIADILVNTSQMVYVERNGKLERTDVRFHDDRHLLQVIDRIVSSVGRRIDDASPMVDARLPDGSRVNAIIPPLAIDGPHLSIRKFNDDGLSADDLVRTGSLSEPMLRLLEGVVRSRLNVLISGGTGAGKDDAAQRSVGVHPHHRAHRDGRGLGRAPAPPAARGPTGDPARQRGGHRRHSAAAPRRQRAADAPRPDHRRARSAAPRRWTCCRP